MGVGEIMTTIMGLVRESEVHRDGVMDGLRGWEQPPLTPWIEEEPQCHSHQVLHPAKGCFSTPPHPAPGWLDGLDSLPLPDLGEVPLYSLAFYLNSYTFIFRIGFF
jgi:hypothetical protein